MRRQAPMALLILVLGCNPPEVQVPLVHFDRPLGAAAGPVGEWRPSQLIEFAPGQMAAFAWDDTGVYGCLAGTTVPRAIHVRMSVDMDAMEVSLEFMVSEERLRWVWVVPSIASGPEPVPVGLSEENFKWLGQPSTKETPFRWGRVFWVPWKALRLDGAPKGQVAVAVEALQRNGSGASFAVDRSHAPNGKGRFQGCE